MDRNEAIKLLKDTNLFLRCSLAGDIRIVQAMNMAIEALEQPEIIHCKDCKHWDLQVGNVKGDGLGSCGFHNVNLVTGEGFCYWADRRGEADG